MAVCYDPSWYIDVNLDRVPNEERTVMASWICEWENVDNFEVFWRYGLPNGKYIDSTSSVSYISYNISYQNKFTYPENAIWVQVWVRPHEKNEGTKDSVWYYTCDWSPGIDGVWFYVYDYAKPKNIGTPTIERNEYKVTVKARTDDIDYDPNTQYVEFYVIDQNSHADYYMAKVDLGLAEASATFNGQAGYVYKVCARGYNKSYDIKGEWSSYSETLEMPPSSVDILNLTAVTNTSVRVGFGNLLHPTKQIILDGSQGSLKDFINSTNSRPSSAFRKYTIEIQYSDTKEFLLNDNDPHNQTASFEWGDYDEAFSPIIEGIETGKKWYFTARRTNDAGSSIWSRNILSVILGIRPSPPTTWSSSVTARVGETVRLNWNHNSRDGSHLKEAQVQIEMPSETVNIGVPGKQDADTNEWLNTGYFDFNTGAYAVPDGSIVRWKARTRGALPDFSDYSVTREIRVYAPPVMNVSVYKTQTPSGSGITSLDSFPFYILAETGPETQKPISFHVSIASNDSYKKLDYNGEWIWVNKDEVIYSHFFDFDPSQDYVEFEDYAIIQNNKLVLKVMPYDVDLESGKSYIIRVTASMTSGLTCENYANLSVKWQGQELYPQADVQVDKDNFTATIVPYCPIMPTGGPDGMIEYVGPDGLKEDLPLVEDVLLSVYRIDYDGRMTKIIDGVENKRATAVVDPHPSIDYARYRIVAISNKTGSIGYVDIEPVKIGQPGIVIQWDEEWKQTVFSNPYDNQLEGVAGWTGSRLTLPFNVKVSESNQPDRSTVEYIGQEHPTSYFGTQLGTTASWTTVIERDDSERLELIRRLNRYQGNVYVRNSRGVGYWAIVELSYDISYGDEGESLLIPVTINVTRVRGGI